MPLPKRFNDWSVPVSGGGDEDVQVLTFSMETQQASQWCWAAVAASVARFYDPASPWTQCVLANHELGRTDCCDGEFNRGPCDCPKKLGPSLARTGNLRSRDAGTVPAGVLAEEIQEGNPVACRVGWRGGGGHFVVIYGLTAGGQPAPALVHVADPAEGMGDDPGINIMEYDVFCGSYMGSGVWTHSYTVQPQGEE